MRIVNIDLSNQEPIYECGICGEANATKLVIDVSSLPEEASFYIPVFKNQFSNVICGSRINASDITDFNLAIELVQQLTTTAKEDLVIEVYIVDEDGNIKLLEKSPKIHLAFESSFSSDNAIEWDVKAYGLYAELIQKSKTFDNGLVQLSTQIEQVQSTAENFENSISIIENRIDEKQTVLKSGENIKTVNGESLLGSGNIAIERGRDGDKGDKGEQGERGVQGLQGERGLQGIQGEKGERGPAGEDGQDYVLTESDKIEIAEIVKSECLDELEAIIDESGVLE